MKNTALLIFSLIAISSAAQNIEKYPHFMNSITLEFAAPVSYLVAVNGTRYSNRSAMRLPSTFLSAEFRVKKKFYTELGILPSHNPDIMYFDFPSSYLKSTELTCYAGILFKQKLFRNFYFAPSFDLYFSQAKYFYSDTLYENNKYISLGPTLGFEYFISKRISINTDLLNINMGLHFDSESQTRKAYSYWTIYKYFSLGVHYNFDWKKKVEPK